ncbi:hypothetical protein Bravens_00945 [Brevibacterium ravenspurgense]|uniref:Uncharacterized protein n=1 Tax=Brevibacterium ravenspurgense TaxID=479117 RepID=A0A150H7D6_9MICO|nr:hypothetical protein [Brevibacterium ravenspurgense]KXZ57914.1 hypothetical protein Bravens_00945 [Brevibacterium ravenspurgense]
MKLIVALSTAAALQLSPLTAPVERAPATVSIHSVSATDEIDVSPTRNPYRCVIWRVIDKKKFQKYCK